MFHYIKDWPVIHINMPFTGTNCISGTCKRDHLCRMQHATVDHYRDCQATPLPATTMPSTPPPTPTPTVGTAPSAARAGAWSVLITMAAIILF